MAHVTIEQQIGGTVVHLKGQFIGGEETDELRNTLRELSEKNVHVAIVDLEKVTYLNSTALGVLIASYATFAKRDAKIILCNLGKSIENLFVITKLSLVFPIYENLDSAIKSLS
jgi:anti-anti-sigma factor